MRWTINIYARPKKPALTELVLLEAQHVMASGELAQQDLLVDHVTHDIFAAEHFVAYHPGANI
jgi:hypothetical protein